MKHSHEEGKKLFKEILKSDNEKTFSPYPAHKGIRFYYPDGDKWIAVDNKTGDCWTEEFDKEEDAIRYLKGWNPNF